MRKALLIGSGRSRELRLAIDGLDRPEITTLDIEPSHHTDIVWDLNDIPWSIPRRWPFPAKRMPDNSFDEIHAYEILEHLGAQGDYKAFFSHFAEIYRLLKPGGSLLGSCPRWNGEWAWGDPSHSRVISEASFIYLSQPHYIQVGITAMTDFRSVWHGDFEKTRVDYKGEQMYFSLKAHKPIRRSNAW